MKRIILAALLGGLAMFLWDFVAHEVLPLGEAGIKALDSAPVEAALKSEVKQAGFYVFPMADTSGMSAAQKQTAEQQSLEKMRSEPAGIMVVFPQGREFVMPKSLVTQFATDVVTLLLAGWLVSWATALKSLGGRTLFVTLLGLFPTIAMGVPLWNWYGFPTAYMLGQGVTTLISFLLGGLVVAWLVRPRIAG